MALVHTRSSLPQRARWGVPFRTDGGMFRDFDDVFDQLAGRGLGGASSASSYPVDVYETSEDLVVEMAVPGVSADELDISLEGRQLAIRGTLPEPEGDSRRYWLQGIPRGDFSRTLMLPTSVDGDKIEATVVQGMLRLTLPKRDEAKARKIAVQAR